jgi:hypothetical protein
VGPARRIFEHPPSSVSGISGLSVTIQLTRSATVRDLSPVTRSTDKHTQLTPQSLSAVCRALVSDESPATRLQPLVSPADYTKTKLRPLARRELSHTPSRPQNTPNNGGPLHEDRRESSRLAQAQTCTVVVLPPRVYPLRFAVQTISIDRTSGRVAWSRNTACAWTNTDIKLRRVTRCSG